MAKKKKVIRKKEKRVPPTHCTFCGSLLKISQVTYGYDPQTGKPKFAEKRVCPKIVWWNPRGMTLHTDVSSLDDYATLGLWYL